jgi:endonuclease-3
MASLCSAAAPTRWKKLIATILSANTNDVNSGRAFDQLCAAFGGDWDAVRTAPLAAIQTAIRPAGMYNQKAPAIVATLERIKAARGDYDLRFLAALPVDEAMAFLTSLPGVGHKTASIVLLFCFNRPAFPVDTHIQRISQRLGISGRRAAPDKIKTILGGADGAGELLLAAHRPDPARAAHLPGADAALRGLSAPEFV